LGDKHVGHKHVNISASLIQRLQKSFERVAYSKEWRLYLNISIEVTK